MLVKTRLRWPLRPPRPPPQSKGLLPKQPSSKIVITIATIRMLFPIIIIGAAVIIAK